MEKQYLYFLSSLGKRLLPLEMIVEVIPMVQLDYDEDEGNQLYCGLLHFRGRILPVFDLKKPDQNQEKQIHWFLLVLNMETEIALIAHDVYGIIHPQKKHCSELNTGDDHSLLMIKIEEEFIRVLTPKILQEQTILGRVEA